MVGHEGQIILNYLQRWGNPTSLALLNPLCKIFYKPEIDGILGYRDSSHCAVVFGDPLCAQEIRPALIRDFHQDCFEKNKKIIYASVSESYMRWAIDNVCELAIEIGQEVIINPLFDLTAQTGQYAHLLRQKKNDAQRNNVTIQEYHGDDQYVEQSMKKVAHNWLQHRKGLQIYLLPLDLFANRLGKRWFYAQQNGKIIGLLTINRLDKYNGWVLNGGLMVDAIAPKSTTEVMVLEVINQLRHEECNFFSIGTLPSERLGYIEGAGKLSQWMASGMFSMAQKIFKFSDRQRYWKKFKPRLEPRFILFDKKYLSFHHIVGVMRAFNVNF